VRLEVMNPVHIENWGTFVTTNMLPSGAEVLGGAGTGANVAVKSTVVNQSDAPRQVSLAVVIKDPQGKEVGRGESEVKTVAAGQSADFEKDVLVRNPALWDVENPQLCTVVASVKSGQEVLDDQVVPFGVRQIEFKAESGFWINGKNMKLKGVCLHHEAGAFGAAVPEDEWIHRLTALKEIGANAVRTAHNPPSPEFLDACDRVGMLVMDENFDCWEIGKNTYDYHQYFKEWYLTDTRDMVRRDRNHPSIVLYSAGNEIREPRQRPAVAKEILGAMLKVFHENDPTRPVTQAILQPNQDPDGGSYKNGFADLLDVIGTNYRDAELLAAHSDKPTRKIVGTENNKDLNAWAQVRDHAEYSGSFIWTGVDYLGETFAWPSIGAGAGVVDITDKPKTEGYQRASWWLTKPVVYMARAAAPVAGGGRGGPGQGGGGAPGGPAGAPGAGGAAGPGPGANVGVQEDGFVPVAAPAPAPDAANGGGRGGAGRGGLGRGGAAGRGRGRGGAGGGGGRGRGPGPMMDWTPTNQEAHEETIQVYSNCEEVELFLNGQSLGSQPRGAVDSVRTWRVPYAAGTLKAVGKNKGQEAASAELKTAGKPAKVKLETTAQKLFADFDSVAHVRAVITDDQGVEVPTATDMVTFKVSGPGEIAAIENAQLVNQPFRGNEHAAYKGECVAFVRATAGGTGKITVTASGPGLAESVITLDVGEGRVGH
jgi:beta-galactosidase